MRRALVTGAAGFLGSHLCERLLEDDVEVVGIDCFTPFYAPEAKRRNVGDLVGCDGFELFEADLSRDPLDPFLVGVDTVFHLAAQAGVRPSFGAAFESYVRHNVLGSQRLLEKVAARGEVSSFVYASSSSVYGNPDRVPSREDDPRRPRSPYGMTKLATEELAGVYHRTCGLPVVGLRYFTVYGPRQRPDMAFSRFIECALEGRPLTVLGDGRQLRDFTFVADAVDATIAAADLGEPGTVYNIGGGRPVELFDAIEILSDLLGGVDIHHEPAARGDVLATCADAARATADLHSRPRTPLRDGIAQQVAWRLDGEGREAATRHPDRVLVPRR